VMKPSSDIEMSRISFAILGSPPLLLNTTARRRNLLARRWR
jgi:hypothetical protein